MKHKHRWNMRGIVSDRYRLGFAHRMCSSPSCRAELYEPATLSEIKKHDDGSVEREMKRLGFWYF